MDTILCQQCQVNMVEIDVLRNLGFSEKEAKIYLALLEMGTGTAMTISKKADIKRPTTYLILEELKKKGLVSEIPEQKHVFAAENPEVLQKNLKQNLANLGELLPIFKAKFNRGEKPKIKYYEGKDNLYKLYFNKIFTSSINF